MKKYLLIIMVLLLSSVATAGINVKYIDGPSDNHVRASVYNEGSTKRNVQAYAYFPDQEEYSRHPSFTFREERPKRLNFIFESLEVVKPGYYPLIIYLSNPKGFRQKEHTWVYLE